MFSKFENRYIIKGDIETQTAIHIGDSNNSFYQGNNKNYFLKDMDDNPLIPGSSLKGVMRSFTEQILLSNELIEKEFGKSPCTTLKPCIDVKNDESYKAFIDKKEYEKLCIICKVFGSSVNASKFMIRDAKVIEETFYNRFEVRSGVAIDRELGKSRRNHFYEIEVVPEGTKFSFYAIAENLDDKEWECIKLILKAMKVGFINIGGGVSKGFGNIVLDNIKIKKIDKNNIFNYLVDESSIKFEKFMEE